MRSKIKAVLGVPKTAHKYKANNNSNSAQNQRLTVLQALYIGPKTTFQLSRQWDIYYPPARVKELRNQGYDIVTHRRNVVTESGKSHRVGLYTLTPTMRRGRP